MPINMSCPSCGKTLSAPDAAAGKKAKCPACSQVMIVPGVGTGTEMSSSPPDDHPAADHASTAPAAGSGTNWLDDLGAQAPAQQGADADARRPCPECGEMIATNAVKCRFCGAIFDPRLAFAARSSAGTSYNGQAVASMVLGILAFPGLCVFTFPGIIMGVMAIIFGGMALSGMGKSRNTQGKGMAIAGLVLGIVVVALTVVSVIVFIALPWTVGPRGFR
jgi:predicted RNA-binding Zn-ribbon protein involved in translation (DUF1610 family)